MSLAVVPTLASLALRGLADPKRRRAAREVATPWACRSLALAGVIASGLFVVLTAGPVAFLLWGAGVTLVGWGLAESLAGLPAAVLQTGDRVINAALEAGLGRSAAPDPAAVVRRWSRKARVFVSGWLALPRNRWTALAVAGGLVIFGAALSARHLAAEAVETTGRMVGLQALALFHGAAEARDRVRPCLRTLDATSDAALLRDLLSDRAVTVPIDDVTSDVGTDLQRCVLSHGGEGATVEREAGVTRFTLAPEVVGAIHADVVRELLLLETMAELRDDTPAARDLICRHVFLSEADDAAGVVAALQRDRTYAKARDLLLRLAALDRPADLDTAAKVCRE